MSDDTLRAVQDGPNVRKFADVSDVYEWTRVHTTRSVPNDDGTAMVDREEWWDIPSFVVAALATSATDDVPQPTPQEERDAVLAERLDWEAERSLAEEHDRSQKEDQ